MAQQEETQITIGKLIELMREKHTEQLIDRQVIYVDRIIGSNSPYNQGFYYKDLAELEELIFMMLQRSLAGYEEITEALEKIIKHCNKPFRRLRGTDEIQLVPKLPQFLDAVSILLKFDKSRIKIDTEETPQVANCLSIACANFIAEFAKQGCEDYSMSAESEYVVAKIQREGSKNLVALHNSVIPDTLVNALADNILDRGPLLSSVVEAIARLSIYSKIAEKFGILGTLKDLVNLICSIENFRDPIVTRCLTCIWNILELGGLQPLEALANEEVVFSLRFTFENIVKFGYKLDDKRLRNEIGILVNHIASIPEAQQYFVIEGQVNQFGNNTQKSFYRSQEKGSQGTEQLTERSTRFLELLLNFSTHDELSMAVSVHSGKAPVKNIFSTSTEDLEFKKLLWSIVAKLVGSEHPEAINLLIQSDLVSALLLYLDPSQNNMAVQRWQLPQLKEIQIHALIILFRLIPLIPEHFQQQNGNYCIISFLSLYSDNERRLATLKALLMASQFPQFRKELSEEGTFDVLYEIVNNEANYPLEHRELAVSIISNICIEYRANQKEFRRKGWIEMISQSLLHQQDQEEGNSVTYQLALLDCI